MATHVDRRADLTATARADLDFEAGRQPLEFSLVCQGSSPGESLQEIPPARENYGDGWATVAGVESLAFAPRKRGQGAEDRPLPA